MTNDTRPLPKADHVWITGVGAVTPLGNSYAEIARGLMEGRSGVSSFVDDDRVRSPQPMIAGQVAEIPLPRGYSAEAFSRRNRLEQLVLSCCVQALDDAGWWDRRSEVRVGLVLGLGAEWLRLWELDWLAGGNRFWDPVQDRESVVNAVRRELQLRGPASTVAAACASGNVAIALARRWLQLGWVDVCLAGGCDLVTPMSLASFGNLRALSRRCEDPAGASRPFDRDRDGFVMAEGGAVFAMEPEAGARARGARAYGEVAGYGAASDATHMIIPSTDPGPAAQAIRRALADARVRADEIDYLNAHATSTPVGDRAERNTLQLALGEAVRKIAVSSTKSMTGHLISGAAAVEALACLAALDQQAVPPTINLDNPDPECELCHVPHHAREQRVRVAVSNSFGFGGSNTCLVLRKVA